MIKEKKWWFLSIRKYEDGQSWWVDGGLQEGRIGSISLLLVHWSEEVWNMSSWRVRKKMYCVSQKFLKTDEQLLNYDQFWQILGVINSRLKKSIFPIKTFFECLKYKLKPFWNSWSELFYWNFFYLLDTDLDWRDSYAGCWTDITSEKFACIQDI